MDAWSLYSQMRPCDTGETQASQTMAKKRRCRDRYKAIRESKCATSGLMRMLTNHVPPIAHQSEACHEEAFPVRGAGNCRELPEPAQASAAQGNATELLRRLQKIEDLLQVLLHQPLETVSAQCQTYAIDENLANSAQSLLSWLPSSVSSGLNAAASVFTPAATDTCPSLPEFQTSMSSCPADTGAQVEEELFFSQAQVQEAISFAVQEFADTVNAKYEMKERSAATSTGFLVECASAKALGETNVSEDNSSPRSLAKTSTSVENSAATAMVATTSTSVERSAAATPTERKTIEYVPGDFVRLVRLSSKTHEGAEGEVIEVQASGRIGILVVRGADGRRKPHNFRVSVKPENIEVTASQAEQTAVVKLRDEGHSVQDLFNRGFSIAAIQRDNSESVCQQCFRNRFMCSCTSDLPGFVW